MRSRILALVRQLTSLLALVGAVGVLAMLLHVTADVVARQVLTRSIPATVEIVSRYYMLLIAFLPLGWTERRGEMISVDLFSGLFRGPLDRINMAFVHLLSLAAFLLLAYTTWFAAMREFGAKSFVLSLSVAVPVWPGFFILPVAFALASVVTALRLYLCLTGQEDAEAFTETGERGTQP
ncbi:TRAP transporter small permease [Chelativorans sp. AA-79]|uniref:TRAP transporter small permease n=1 Tax=Chelativorans sp. AA-79 TaxID=3028735 RepID=UPI0023F64882|nr:TRAP transporter small permease [Chelativorans sp. AA-79]WEX10547.1 TRAP transporter small permease [Chelativorans sp. AA-79]